MAAVIQQPRAGEPTSLAGLGRALVQHQMLRLDQATTIQRKADSSGTTFIDELIGGGHMQARQLAKFSAEVFGHPLLDLSAIDPTTLPQDVLDRMIRVPDDQDVDVVRGGRDLVQVDPVAGLGRYRRRPPVHGVT